MPAHYLPTCPICYATAAFATVLLAAVILWVRDVLRVHATRWPKPKPWYRSSIKLPRTRADDFTVVSHRVPLPRLAQRRVHRSRRHVGRRALRQTRAARKMGLPCDGIERDHHYCIDLAAPCAGIDSADVIRVDPPATPVVPVAPTHTLPSLDRDVVRSVPTVTVVGPRQMSAPVLSVDAQAPVMISTPVPSLEIPVSPRLVADDFVSVPPMFPRLPGAPEYP